MLIFFSSFDQLEMILGLMLKLQNIFLLLIKKVNIYINVTCLLIDFILN